MDKLEPILRHKFWIVFGLTLPIALFAYYSASGEMSEATKSQEDKLSSTISSIPKGDSDPNETYAEGAKVINDELQERFDEQVQKLWEMQTERMTWPKIVVPFVPDTYRGEIDSKARYTYQRVYPGVIERLWERVQPYVGDPKDRRSSRTLANFKPEWPQKVIIDGQKIPHANFDMSAPADNKEIWDAQEDIWLLELIFDAVVRTNADAQFVSDAPVRQIDKIELVGGSGESSVTSAPSGGGGGFGGEEMPGMDDAGMAMMGGMGGAGGRGGPGGGLGAPAKVAFNVAEEFGPPVPDESSVDSSAMSDSSMAGEMAYADGAGFGGGGMFGAAPNVKMQRYIGPSGFDPFEGSYRERGFYMSVIILQDRIPQFLAELSSSPWPIRIGRFHIGPNPYAERQRRSGSGFGMGFGGMGMEFDDMGMGAEDYAVEGMGGFGGMGMGGFGGMGSARSQLKLPDYMKMPSSIPSELRSHPDLVQMDLCGIITMYNPVTSDEVEATDDGSTEEEFQDELEQSAETPEEAQAMAAEQAAEEAAAAATEAAEGAAETPADSAPSEGASADGAAPAEGAAPAQPGPAEADAQAPPAEPSGEEPAAAPPQDADGAEAVPEPAAAPPAGNQQ